MSNEDHIIPSILARTIMNFGSQLIYGTFLDRQQNTMLKTAWQTVRINNITVPVFPISIVISFNL